MKPRWTSLLLISLCAGLALTTVWMWHRHDLERARADSLAGQLENIKRSRGTLPTASQLQAPGPDFAISPSNVVVPESGTRPEVAAQVNPRAQEYAARLRKLMGDPGYREASVKIRRTQYGSRRAELIRALGISASDADRIIDFWARREVIKELSTSRLGATNDAEEISAIYDEEAHAMAAIERELGAAVGSDVVDRLVTFEEASEIRQMVEDFRGRLASAHLQLREHQIEPLIEMLRTEGQRAAEEVRAFNGSLNWDPSNALQSRVLFHQQRVQAFQDSIARLRHLSRTLLDEHQARQLDILLGEQQARFEAQMELVSAESRIADSD